MNLFTKVPGETFASAWQPLEEHVFSFGAPVLPSCAPASFNIALPLNISWNARTVKTTANFFKGNVDIFMCLKY